MRRRTGRRTLRQGYCAPVPDAPTDRAWRRPRIQLGVAIVLLAASIAVAWGAADELGIGSLRLSDAEGDAPPGQAELAVRLSGGEGVTPDQAAFRTSQEVVATQLRSDPAIAAVNPVAQDDEVALVVEFSDVSSADRQEAADRIAAEIDPGALRAHVEGEIVRAVQARDELEDELWRNTLIVLPVALLVLVAAAGGVRRAAAPFICAALAVAGTLAILRLLGLAADISLLSFAPAAAVGLVLGVEFPLRALRDADAPERDTRLALAVAATAALPGFALLATPLDQAASLALGAAIAALLAMAATRLVVPPVVMLAGAGTSPPAPPKPPRVRRWRWLGPAAAALAIVALAALVVPAFVYGGSAPFAALGAAASPVAERSLDDSLFPDLATAAGIAAAVLAALLAWLGRSPLWLLLGPLSLLPAGAALGVCAFLAEHSDEIGRTDPDGSFLDTGAVAIAACTIVAISAGRSALGADAFSVGRRLELTPATASTAVGLLAAGALYLATDLDQADQLGIGLAVGLLADLVLLRLPLRAATGRWVGSRA